jgi:hypothetical protein
VPVASNTSADGNTRVDFFESPWRHYLVNGDDKGRDHIWTPEEPWGRVASVTQAIGVVDKSGPLQHYASNKTLEGIARLVLQLDSRGRLPFPAAWLPLASGETEESRAELAGNLLKGSLRRRKLMFYDRTREAADRGLDVHKIAEDWLERQAIPNLIDYPEDRRGYVQGFAKWLMAAKPKLIDSEMVVGSVQHGYAGRLDMTIVIQGQDGRTSLRDIKTSKAVYPRQHFPQLMAYENARVEMGEAPTDDQGILLLTASGEYREVLARDATFADFRVLLEAHRSQSAIPECAECWELKCKCRRRRAR